MLIVHLRSCWNFFLKKIPTTTLTSPSRGGRRAQKRAAGGGRGGEIWNIVFVARPPTRRATRVDRPAWGAVRKRVALELSAILCAMSLAACGFHPLYGRGGASPAIMASIYVDPIPDRTGYELRNSLTDLFDSGGGDVTHVRTGQVAPPKFPYQHPGEIPGDASRRADQFADRPHQSVRHGDCDPHRRADDQERQQQESTIELELERARSLDQRAIVGEHRLRAPRLRTHFADIRATPGIDVEIVGPGESGDRPDAVA